MAEARRQSTVLVGRFGNEPEKIVVRGRTTVKDVLTKANIETGSHERIWVNGARATMKTVVGSGDIVSIVSPKEAGK